MWNPWLVEQHLCQTWYPRGAQSSGCLVWFLFFPSEFSALSDFQHKSGKICNSISISLSFSPFKLWPQPALLIDRTLRSKVNSLYSSCLIFFSHTKIMTNSHTIPDILLCKVLRLQHELAIGDGRLCKAPCWSPQHCSSLPKPNIGQVQVFLLHNPWCRKQTARWMWSNASRGLQTDWSKHVHN